MKKQGTHRLNEKRAGQTVTILKDGPYQFSGSIPLGEEIIILDTEGTPLKWEKGKQFPLQRTYCLCRCGNSANKPFCDGAHVKKGFIGTETASREPFDDKAKTFAGPGLVLRDDPSLCAIARFCHRAGDTWTLTKRSQDPLSKETAIQEACDCPSGRLVAIDKKTNKPIEPTFSPSVSVIEDAHNNISGPLWVKGGIPVLGADGKEYEVRNRVTLCRCGKSKNKPFCDGTHACEK